MKKIYHAFSCTRLIVILAVTSFSFLSAQAQSIFTNPITGTNPNTADPYTTGQTVDANITVSGIGRGVGITGTNTNDRYNATSWNTVSLDATAYFEWTITPNASFEIDFVSLVYTGQASGAGPTNFALRSSLDSYTADIGVPTATGTTISLSGATYQNITSAITFRFYGWNASGSTGTFSINDFTFNGTVSAVPPTLSINNVSLNEANSSTTTFTFTVSLSAPAGAGGVTFDIATANGTATTADNDYTAKSLTSQTIPQGSDTYMFDVVVNGDVTVEPNETFFVNVTNVVGATVTDGQGQGTIQNDDVAAASTTTTIASNLNPSFTGNNVAFTATVTSSGSPVTTGTVTFTEGPTILAANVALNGSGQASFSISTLTEGSHNITATYNGTSSFLTSNGSVTQTVNNVTIVNGNNFCNTGNITFSDGNSGGTVGTPATPYPSNIFVSGLSGTIQSITVDVNGLTHNKPSDIDLLLVAPTGEKFLLMTGVGRFTTFNNTNLTLSDAGASALPQIFAIPSGTYRPASHDVLPDIFPAPAPAGPYNQPDPKGTSTFASVFNGLDPNGTWQLYAVDDTTITVGSIANGWCLNINTTPPCTPPDISDEPDAVIVCAGSATSFTVAASGSGTLSYQWQEDGIDLTNTGVYSNVTTATLNISDVTGLNGKKYQVIITNDNGTPDDASDDCSSTSEEVMLTVLDPQAGTLSAMNPVICEGGDLGLMHTGFSGQNNFFTIAYRKSDGSLVGAGTILGPNSAIEQAIEAAGPGEYCILIVAQATKPGDFETGACGINQDLSTFAFADLNAFRACLQDQLDKGVCVDWDEFCVTVNPIPTATVTAVSPICQGENAVFKITATPNTSVYANLNGFDPPSPPFLGGDSIHIGANGMATLTIVNPAVNQTLTLYQVANYAPIYFNTSCRIVNINESATVVINSVSAGSIGSDQMICAGGDPAAFTSTTDGTGSGSISYRWESSTTDCEDGFSAIDNTNSPTYDASNLTVTTYFRRITISDLNGKVCEAISNCVTVTVNPAPTGTFSISDDEICEGEAPFLQFQATTGTPNFIITFGGGNINPGTTTQTVGNGNPFWTLNTDWYNPGENIYTITQIEDDNGCITPLNEELTLVVNPLPTGIFTLSDAIICEGDEAFLQFQATVGTPNFTITFGGGNINPGTTTQTVGNGNPFWTLNTDWYNEGINIYTITQIEDANGCITMLNEQLTLVVNNVDAGTIAADQTICSGGNPAAFTSTTDGTGFGTITYRWESSILDCEDGFSTIDGATAATYDAPTGLTVTTYYRRVTISTVNGVACEAISNCLIITVNQINPGEIGGSQTVCTTKDPAPFTSVTAATGSGIITYQWESSTTNCEDGFTPILNATGETFDPAKGQFPVTTYFRRRAISSLNDVSCDAVSNCVTLTVLNVDCGQFPWNGN